MNGQIIQKSESYYLSMSGTILLVDIPSVSWMFSAMTLVSYMSAHIRLEIAAAFGSSFNIRAALLVDDTFILSTPFKCLSSHNSHCPNAYISPCHSRKIPVDVNISALSHLFDIVPVEHAGLEQTPPRKLSSCHVSSLERDQRS
jgi:hypothetical protein